jgi:hypothetical protein
MCLIVHKPAGRAFNLDLITQAASVNRDGFGLMWPEDGKLQTVKILDMTQLRHTVELFNKRPEIEAGLHLRYATHGTISNDNCHPFSRNGFGLMHNGIISHVKTKGDESDTRAFCRAYAWPMLRRHGINVDTVYQLASLHGPGNRLLVADSAGNFARTGDWTEVEGCQYSNTSYFWSSKSFAKRARIDFQPDSILDMSSWSYHKIARYVKNNPKIVTDLIYQFFDDIIVEDEETDKNRLFLENWRSTDEKIPF